MDAADHEPLRPNQFSLRTALLWLTIVAALFAIVRWSALNRDVSLFGTLFAFAVATLLLIAMCRIARDPLFKSSVSVGWLGTVFGGAIYGVVGLGASELSAAFGLTLFCIPIGMIWATIFSPIGLAVSGLLVLMFGPQQRVMRNIIAGSVTGYASVAFQNPFVFPKDPMLVAIPTFIGGACAGLATAVHVAAAERRSQEASWEIDDIES